MRTREEMKAALRVEAEVVIEELLDQVEGEEPTLAQLEDILLRLRKRLGERMGRVVIEGQEATRLVSGDISGSTSPSTVSRLAVESSWFPMSPSGGGTHEPIKDTSTAPVTPSTASSIARRPKATSLSVKHLLSLMVFLLRSLIIIIDLSRSKPMSADALPDPNSTVCPTDYLSLAPFALALSGTLIGSPERIHGFTRIWSA
jgi:hypothetical protein